MTRDIYIKNKQLEYMSEPTFSYTKCVFRKLVCNRLQFSGHLFILFIYLLSDHQQVNEPINRCRHTHTPPHTHTHTLAVYTLQTVATSGHHCSRGASERVVPHIASHTSLEACQRCAERISGLNPAYVFVEGQHASRFLFKETNIHFFL